VITDFATEFRTVINGTNTAALSLDQLSGGARIAFVFHELFSTAIKNLDPFNEIKDADIRTILFSTAASLLAATRFFGLKQRRARRRGCSSQQRHFRSS
jgi:hypothetical protein